MLAQVESDFAEYCPRVRVFVVHAYVGEIHGGIQRIDRTIRHVVVLVRIEVHARHPLEAAVSSGLQPYLLAQLREVLDELGDRPVERAVRCVRNERILELVVAGRGQQVDVAEFPLEDDRSARVVEVIDEGKPGGKVTREYSGHIVVRVRRDRASRIEDAVLERRVNDSRRPTGELLRIAAVPLRVDYFVFRKYVEVVRYIPLGR